MKKKLRDAWVAALRSGNYPQTRGCLNRSLPGLPGIQGRTPVGFCCLGVLADIHPDVEWIEGDEGRRKVAVYKGNIEYGSTGTLPEAMVCDMGWNHETQLGLWEQNDEMRKNFYKIADWIEANIPID